MQIKNYTGIVPLQNEGKQIDTEAFAELENNSESRELYQKAKYRLLDVNRWHSIAGTLTAEFRVVDQSGNEVSREVQAGDYFKIDIPGPGPDSGDGYDWVKVEEIKEVNENNIDSIGIRVRPCSSPQNNDKGVAHFYSPDSTSNFIITREGNTVTASVYDRNTKTNTEGEEGMDKVRHTAVGAGAISLFSKLQWKSLVNALIKID